MARKLGDCPVPEFGASDCDCESHLARFPDAETASNRVADLYEQFR